MNPDETTPQQRLNHLPKEQRIMERNVAAYEQWNRRRRAGFCHVCQHPLFDLEPACRRCKSRRMGELQEDVERLQRECKLLRARNCELRRRQTKP